MYIYVCMQLYIYIYKNQCTCIHVAWGWVGKAKCVLHYSVTIIHMNSSGPQLILCFLCACTHRPLRLK